MEMTGVRSNFCSMEPHPLPSLSYLFKSAIVSSNLPIKLPTSSLSKAPILPKPH
jgi:hypothetical protein